jgi:hypothetical protein
VGWATIEAVARYHGGEPLRGKFEAIAGRRGKTKAHVVIARRLLTLVHCGLRDARSVVWPTERRRDARQPAGNVARQQAWLPPPRWRSRESD